MAETAESAPKTSELYLGIVDLFAVILPGAIITFLVQKGLNLESHPEWFKGAQGWAVFLAVSYIVGHVVSAAGGLLLDKVYDTGFKLHKDHSSYFRIRLRARDLMQSVLKSFYSEKDNAMEWAGMITRLRSTTASAEIDRLEADSKFFRSLMTVLILGWPIWIFILVRNPQFSNLQARGLWTRVAAFALALASFLVVVWLRRFVGHREDVHERQKTRVQAPQGPPLTPLEDRVSKDVESAQPLAVPCWKATLVAMLIWVLLVIGSGALLTPILAFIGAGCGVLAAFSGWRYMGLRLKRTRLTYAYVIALSLQDLNPNAPKTTDP
jgi:hypothetical protein